MSTIVTLTDELSRSEMIACLEKVLSQTYDREKSAAISISMVDIMEAKHPRPRQGYKTRLIANTATSEVHFLMDKKYSFLNVETKVTVANLKYVKKSPWSKFMLRLI